MKIEKKKFENTNLKKKILVYDVPLIYETKSEKDYDLIILANCNPDIQKRRVLIRDKISDSLYEQIIKSQLSFDEKMKFNPKIIDTNNLKFIVLIRIISLLCKILINLKIEKWKKKES